MMRDQVNVTVSRLLRSAVRYAAEKDGLTMSAKVRQILTQQLGRTMETPAFLDWVASGKADRDD